MEPYRYLREDIMSGQLSDIEVNGARFTETINRPQGLDFSVPLRSEFADDQVLDPWRTAVYVVQGSNVVSGGILTPPRLDLGGTALSCSCFGWTGYLDRRIIRTLIGQAEQGALIVAKPTDDATSTNVGPLPQGSVDPAGQPAMWPTVAGAYSRLIGIVPQVGHSGTWLAHFNVPTTGLDFHPISGVTVGLVVSGVGAANACAPIVRIGGNTYQPGGTVVNPGGVYDLSHTWTTNPATGLAWTAADIYAFNAGGSTAGVLTSVAATLVDVVVNQVWMTVQYQAGFNDYFGGTDQFTIFKMLVDDAQSQTRFGLGYDLGINVVWDQLSGVNRDKQGAYTPWQAKNLGDALRQLAANDNGFDFSMELALNLATDRVDKQIRLSYPFQGRETGFLFEYETPLSGAVPTTNVISRGFADPVQLAWTGDGWGSGNDTTRLRSPYIDQSLRGVYPPYDAAPSFSDETIQSALDAETQGFFNRVNRPSRAPILRVDPDLDPRWGDFGLGDIVRCRVLDGYGSVDDRFRVVTRTVDVDAGTYDIVLDDLDVIGAGGTAL